MDKLDLNSVDRFVIENYIMIMADDFKRMDVIKYISDNRKLYQKNNESEEGLKKR